MLTNFHLPKSTLLMLVSAFAGRERVLQAYEHAVRENTGSIHTGIVCSWSEIKCTKRDLKDTRAQENDRH